MPTSPEQEFAEQARWTLRPHYANAKWFDRLVSGEFTDAQTRRRALDRGLSQILRFACHAVPHFKAVAGERGINAASISTADALADFPILRKAQILEAPAAFQASQLPAAEKIAGTTRSTGTTGKPVEVTHTMNALALNEMLVQRQFRWYRLDPARTFAAIRIPAQLPPTEDGGDLLLGETGRSDRWPQVGRYFKTGEYACFSVLNPVEAQLDWLATERPAYLASYAESLEHLALACDGEARITLEAVNALSEQLTPEMRRRIERTLAPRVNQNYGLNETGLVASKCLEGDRYHVHSEHCVVEIIDDDGRPCAHGETGHVLVTILNNPAMPLIRYDTDDLAVCLTDPCPCGRTLPSFGEVVGRYSRIAFLPDGTMALVGALRAALEAMPGALIAGLRRYQVHQFRDGRFEVRIQSTAPMPAAFETRLREAWATAGGDAPALTFKRVVEIYREPGGKFQDFTSDYFPAADHP